MAHNVNHWVFPSGKDFKAICRSVFDGVLNVVKSDYPDEYKTDGWENMAATAADISFDASRVFDSVGDAEMFLDSMRDDDYNSYGVLAYNANREKVWVVLTDYPTYA